MIAYTFPPYQGIGGRRWAKFAKALARKGYTVHVIHSKGPEDMKGSFWTEDIQHPNIIVHPLPQRYPTVLFKRRLTSLWEKVMYRFWLRALPLVVRGNPLDKTVLWRKQLLNEAGRLIQAHGIKHVMVTGAPFRLLAFGVDIKRAHGISLTCDLRDPWTWHDAYGFAKLDNTRRTYERQLEREVMEASDHVVSPHRSVIEHLRNSYPAQAPKCVVLPHAVDPDELGTPSGPRSDNEFRLIYAGSLYGEKEAEAYFGEVLKAFSTLRDTAPERFALTRLDLYITGPDTRAYQQRILESGMQDRIRFHEPLPTKEIFDLLRRANAILTFIPSFNKDLLGTKFTEIFYLRRPVIHVGERGDVSDYILKHHLGISLAVSELAVELPKIMLGQRTIAIDPEHDLSAHMLDHITSQLEHDVLGLA